MFCAGKLFGNRSGLRVHVQLYTNMQTYTNVMHELVSPNGHPIRLNPKVFSSGFKFRQLFGDESSIYIYPILCPVDFAKLQLQIIAAKSEDNCSELTINQSPTCQQCSSCPYWLSVTAGDPQASQGGDPARCRAKSSLMTSGGCAGPAS